MLYRLPPLIHLDFSIKQRYYVGAQPFDAGSLFHFGVKGMKWGVRRTPEELGHIKKPYEIKDPSSGESFHLSKGSRIRDPKVFAGKGTRKELGQKVKQGLTEQLGGDPDNWQHCKGFGTINYHWFQEPSVGKSRFKIKRWLDE